MEKTMRGSAKRWMAGATGLAAAVMLAACGGGGGGGDGTMPQGTLKMSMTDAPACYEKVLVTVERVRVQRAQGGWEDIVPAGGPVQLDLLKLTNGDLAALGSAEVDATTYTQVRLVLAENTVDDPFANAVKPVGKPLQALKTPSAQQSGLKIDANFTVAADATTEMLLDFDGCKSVVYAGNSGQYILKPVVRFSSKPAGSIAGYVTTTMALSATSVSAQQGGEIVRSTTPDNDGLFRLAYLAPGTYTVVITSEDRATGVISTVPVGTTTTTVNGTASYIVLPTSPMNTVTGVVTAGGVPLGDATVTARQDVAVEGPIQVLSVPVDFELATYTMRLPTADPVRAPYLASGLVFVADPTAAGKYQLTVTSPNRSPITKTVDSRAAPAPADFAY